MAAGSRIPAIPRSCLPVSCFRVDQQLALVSRYVSGSHLGELLVRRGRFPASVVWEIGRQLADGLETLAQRGLYARPDIRARQRAIDHRRHGRARRCRHPPGPRPRPDNALGPVARTLRRRRARIDRRGWPTLHGDRCLCARVSALAIAGRTSSFSRGGSARQTRRPPDPHHRRRAQMVAGYACLARPGHRTVDVPFAVRSPAAVCAGPA